MNIRQLKDRAWAKPKRVVFTEGTDLNVLRAARTLAETGWARPIIVGNPFKIREFAEKHKMHLRGISLKKPIHDPNFDTYSRFYRKNVEPGLSYLAAKEKLQQPLWYAALLIKNGQADFCLTAAQTDLAELLAIEAIFSKEKPFVSAATAIGEEDGDRLFLFADTFINARPNAGQLAHIAFDTGQTFQKLSGREPRIALLSFSTKGSADHPRVQTVRDAVQELRACCPNVQVEGELQFDAAFVPEILQKKAPQSALRDSADVFIFPSLNAADPALKIVQTLTPLSTIGLILQGLHFPVHWLLPETSDEQIIHLAVVASNLLNA